MTRRPDAEARATKLDQLIDTHTHAVENSVLIGCKPIVRAVAIKTGEHKGDASLNCDTDEAEALVRAAVLGGSALVGVRIAEVVRFAIYSYALPLAEKELADIERRRDEESASDRVQVECWKRLFSQVTA